MPIRPILLLGLSVLAVSAAQAQVDTYPLGAFVAASLPVLLRADALAPQHAFGPGWDDLVSLTDLGLDVSDIQTQDVPGKAGQGAAPAALARTPVQAATGGTEEAPAADDENALPAPGRFGRSAVKIPSRFLKDQGIATHTPDVSINLDKRTSVGLFGEMSRTSRTDVEANLAKPDREVGAGFTLQYKFGTH